MDRIDHGDVGREGVGRPGGVTGGYPSCGSPWLTKSDRESTRVSMSDVECGVCETSRTIKTTKSVDGRLDLG